MPKTIIYLALFLFIQNGVAQTGERKVPSHAAWWNCSYDRGKQKFNSLYRGVYTRGPDDYDGGNHQEGMLMKIGYQDGEGTQDAANGLGSSKKTDNSWLKIAMQDYSPAKPEEFKKCIQAGLKYADDSNDGFLLRKLSAVEDEVDRREEAVKAQAALAKSRLGGGLGGLSGERSIIPGFSNPPYVSPNYGTNGYGGYGPNPLPDLRQYLPDRRLAPNRDIGAIP